MSIVDLDVQLQTIKTQLAQAQQDFLDINKLSKDFLKILKWYKSDPPDKLIVIDGVEQNREDYDLWINRGTIFSEYMGLLGYTTLGFLESIFRSRDDGNVFSESLQRLRESRKTLQDTIATKKNELESKKTEIIQAMADFHTITL